MELSEVKPAMRNAAVVEYDGGRYYITECIMRFIRNEWVYILKLVEAAHTGHFVIASMEKVKVID